MTATNLPGQSDQPGNPISGSGAGSADSNRARPKPIGHSTPDPKLNPVPEMDFEQISGGSTMVVIRLGAKSYKLKRTRSERLVLHK